MRTKATLMAAILLGAIVGSTVQFGALPSAQAAGGAVLPTADCMTNVLNANDDQSTGLIGLPFEVNFYGQTYSSLYVNNNGNVTFDHPLSTYTPFGLQDTNVPIIAPFFADVDTRGAGSSPVRYGYGVTMYEGHKTFCVNWVNVGYYSGHDDKLNSFQLLLVSRPDKGAGSFDIVFNYDRIQWETGDASGGVAGFGGQSARVGFSSGSGQPGSVTEFGGSGIPGSLLDSSPHGLVDDNWGSSQLGRYIFQVRDAGTVLNGYVALGDSYQSGEGTEVDGSYIAGTDVTDVNMCHRSLKSYPGLLVSRGVVRLTLNLRACAGATIADMLVPTAVGHAPWNDGIAQVNALSRSTRLVTVGIVGNDLNFSGTVRDCVTLSTSNNVGSGVPAYKWSCADSFGTDVATSILSLYQGKLHDDLLDLYRLIRAKAPFARVVVVSYPRFFPVGGASGSCGWVSRPSDQAWMNNSVDQADKAIGYVAREAGFEYVNMADSNLGHEMCTSEPGMNGIVGFIAAGDQQSYHPNRLGHSLMADKLADHLDNYIGPTIAILPQHTETRVFTVQGKRFSVSVGWPGSDVVTTLISPSGQRFTRAEPGSAAHDVGPTWEYYTIEDPEPGTWRVEMYGADVAESGEPVTLSGFDAPTPNLPPAGVIAMTHRGSTYSFDATRSTDADGTINEYQWDFGDGTGLVSGATVQHTFAPGSYNVALVLRDDEGDLGYTTTGVIEVSDLPPASTVLARSSTLLTSGLDIAEGDVQVDGDFECTSKVHVAGAVVVTGDAHLTSSCTIDGDLMVDGAVRLDSSSSVGGTVLAGGTVTMQSSATVGGDIVTAGSFVSTNRRSIEQLQAAGAIGGQVQQGATVSPVSVPEYETSSYEPTAWAGFEAMDWTAWVGSTAASGATDGGSASECRMNGTTVTVEGDLLIDARQVTSSCAAVSFHDATIRLNGDLTIYADALASTAGLTVLSGDGLPHTVQILVPGTTRSCASAGRVVFSPGTTFAANLAVIVKTPGKVTIHGASALNVTVDASCFATSGAVNLRHE